ncbi:hypothetical protein BDY24DRAFT_222305 [Mrakia frigida]|uniref:uncharacterized protein n=1 Tax=Mrakia frigida TaxID=29902 RepID=UPI003FCC0B29
MAYRYPYYRDFPYRFTPAVDCVDDNGTVVCPAFCPDHGRAVVRRTSRTRENPGRPFYSCDHADDADIEYLLPLRQARWRNSPSVPSSPTEARGGRTLGAVPGSLRHSASHPLPYNRQQQAQPEQRRRRRQASLSPAPAPRAAHYDHNNNNSSYYHPLPRPPPPRAIPSPSPERFAEVEAERVAVKIAIARSWKDQGGRNGRGVIVIDDDGERDSDVEILESGKGKGKKRVRDLSEDEEDVVPVKRERSSSSFSSTNRLRTPPSKDSRRLHAANKKIESLQKRLDALETTVGGRS